jgi:hypothetical protein
MVLGKSVDGRNIMPDVQAVQERMQKISDAIRSGEWRGVTGKKIRNIINIGIGGSDLGPRMATEALKWYGDRSLDVRFLSNIDALELLKEAISQRKLKLGIDVFIGLDCAANHYYKNGKYLIKDKPQPVTKEEYIQFLLERVGEYNILILEDPLEEEDFDGWKKITEGIGSKTYIVADDFATGDNQLVKKALEQSACNAVIVKFNQVATITELLELTHILKQKNTKIVFSQRLGETTDSIVAYTALVIGPVSYPRYRIPLEPFLYLITALGLLSLPWKTKGTSVKVLKS